MSGRNDELRDDIAAILNLNGNRLDDEGRALFGWQREHASKWTEKAYRVADAILALPALRATEERARVAEEARDGWQEAARRDLERALRAEARVAELEGALRPEIIAALQRYDKAIEAHLRDCWLAEDSDERSIDARYCEMKAAKDGVMDAVRIIAGDHARTFQAEQERRAAALLPTPEAPRG